MQLNDDFITQWEHIIADVAKTDVPLECIKKVVIKLKGGKQRTVNINTLQKQGLSLDEIETMLTRLFHDMESEIRDVDFIVDVNAVADLVQPETDKLLKEIK